MCKFARFMGKNWPISWAARYGIATPKRPNLPRNERNSSHEASKFTLMNGCFSCALPDDAARKKPQRKPDMIQLPLPDLDAQPAKARFLYEW